jgi:ATP-dependent DNA ligase
VSLPLAPRYAPMEARLVDEIPGSPGWQYEPKWDGFRCLAFRDGDRVELQSKSGQPLARYFPEVVAHLLALPARSFVLDGEIVIPPDGRLSFDDLLQRIHPAASRIERLSRERPAVLIVFDLLVDASRKALVDRPLRERRRNLEAFAAKTLTGRDDIRLSPATGDAAQARAWLDMAGGTLDGIVAKRLDLPYQSGERTGMQKVKRRRTVDCVVGGFHGPRAGRAQPLEHRALGGMGAARAQAGRRGELRPLHGRSLPPRHAPAALAAGQAAAPVHPRSGRGQYPRARSTRFSNGSPPRKRRRFSAKSTEHFSS